MPTLFKCFALRVTMNPRGNEYNPPHVHAYYKDDMAVVDVKTGQVTEGYIPPTQLGITKRFIEENREQLLSLWGMNPQDFDSFISKEGFSK